MKDKWNWILGLLVLGIVLEFVVIVTRPTPPCTESLDVTKGQNFNQPILTEHNCSAGQIPINSKNF